MTQLAQKSHSRQGNTNMARSRNWILTINNFTETQKNEFSKICEKNKYKFIFQIEAGESGTPHIQAWIEATNARTFQSVKTLWPDAHIEKCKKREAAALYCMKDETRTSETFFTNLTEVELHNLKCDAENKKKNKKPTKEDLMGPEPPLEDEIEGLTLYPYQQKIQDIFDGPVDKRKIYWICDNGNKGKTSFAKHMCIKYPYNIIYLSGKGADIKHGVAEYVKQVGNRFKMAIFGFPRSLEDYVSYQSLEEVKDGIFFSGKYESGMCKYNRPHVICLANFLPDTKKLTADRWEIINNLTPEINDINEVDIE